MEGQKCACKRSGQCSQAQHSESNAESVHEQIRRDQDIDGTENMPNQNRGLAPYFHGVETLEDIAKVMPERYLNPNPNHLRPQTQGRFNSHNTSAGLH